MTVKYIDNIDVSGKRVLIRVDYNVPLDKEGNITDDTRIKATLPTLNYCLDNRAKVILISHLGRPKGTVVPQLSLKPVAESLSTALGKPVTFSDTPVDNDSLAGEVNSLAEGEIILLENIRFYEGETKNSEELGKHLGKLADIYVNDAFATAHRGHSSNDAVTKYVDTVAAGFLLKNEIEYFHQAMNDPKRPLVAVIGGAKVSTKLGVLSHILTKIDSLIIGGAMAFTFLKAQDKSVGKSLTEDDLIETAGEILESAKEKGVKVLLPVDVVAAAEFDNNAVSQTVSVDDIPDDMMGLDIGPETIALFGEEVKKAATVIWNGPMGAFEMENFASGTRSVGQTIADSSCLSIIGGGDSVTSVNQMGLADRMSYLSTGGGAFLELMEGKTLPGIAALDK